MLALIGADELKLMSVQGKQRKAVPQNISTQFLVSLTIKLAMNSISGIFQLYVSKRCSLHEHFASSL